MVHSNHGFWRKARTFRYTDSMTKRAHLLYICLSFFAGAVLAGYFSPKAEEVIIAALHTEPDAARPRVQTLNIYKLDTPFANQNNTSPMVVNGSKSSPITDGEAKTFLDSMAAHVYYDPPHQLADLTFLAAGGQTKSLADYKGRYLLLNLWATWCGYCIMELPSLQQLKERYKGGNLDVVAVSVDTNQSLANVETFLKSRGLGDVALNLDDRGDVQYTLPVAVLPVTFLIDPEGRVVYSFGGRADWMSLPALAFLERFAPLNQ